MSLGLAIKYARETARVIYRRWRTRYSVVSAWFAMGLEYVRTEVATARCYASQSWPSGSSQDFCGYESAIDGERIL